MRNIIKEELEKLKFKGYKKIILSLLNENILPNYNWVCKFDVIQQSPTSEDAMMVVIYLKPGLGHQMSQPTKNQLIDKIWYYIFDWVGIPTYEKFVNIDHCDKDNITESRRDKVILDYFDELFNVAEMNWSHPYEMDDDTDEEYEDQTRTLFYYGNQFDDDVVFRYYHEGYFTPHSNAHKKSPILSIENEYKSKLDGYFGNMWHEPLKKWFEQEFGMYVKTVDYM